MKLLQEARYYGASIILYSLLISYFPGMKKVYWLPYCTTSQEVVKKRELDKKGYVFQDIKLEKITPEQLDEMKRLAGSYEKLFSRRANKYHDWNLKDLKLGEEDYRRYILEEYTFLIRPVVITGDEITIGNRFLKASNRG